MSNTKEDFRNKKFNNQKPRKGKTKLQPMERNTSKPPQQKEQKGFSFGPTAVKLLPWIYFLLFAVVAFIYLAVLNKEYLYGCQEHSIWQNNHEYFDDRMRAVGGFCQWLGCYLTQYFYYPWAGTLILIVLWGLIYLLTLKVFRISSRWSVIALAPVVLLLCSEIYLGYWMYYIKMPGYWFTYTVAILIMLAGMYICRLYKGYMRAVLIVLYVVGLYPVIGFWSLCGAGYLALQQLAEPTEENEWNAKDFSRYAAVVLAVAAIIIVPKIYVQHYMIIRPEDAYFALFPQFLNDKYTESAKNMLFIVLACIPLIYIIPTELFQKTEDKYTQPWNHVKSPLFTGIASVVLLAGYFLLISWHNFDDKNFQTELKMYRQLGECDWQGALESSRESEGPHTREMIMGQNLALLHLGSIGYNMFKYDNRTVRPKVFTYVKDSEKKIKDDEKFKDMDPSEILGDRDLDSLRVNLCTTCGPLYYFLYGKTNFSIRWCIENGVEYEFSVDLLKNLIRSAMMTGEDKVAAKYIDILRSTTFHKEWADQRLAMLRDRKLYESSEEYKCVQPLFDAFHNVLDGDQGLVEMYLINYFSHMNSTKPKFQEATLAFSLIQKDISLFWPRFFKYADLHEKEPMPIHYQEAAYLYGDLEHKVDISHMPFDKNLIVNRYASFKNVTTRLLQQYSREYKDDALTQKVGQECFDQFGDTFWWFYYFSRGVHTY